MTMAPTLEYGLPEILSVVPGCAGTEVSKQKQTLSKIKGLWGQTQKLWGALAAEQRDVQMPMTWHVINDVKNQCPNDWVGESINAWADGGNERIDKWLDEQMYE